MMQKGEDTKKEGRWSKWLTLFSTEFIITLFLLSVSIFIFLYAVNLVFVKKTTSFDENVFSYFSGHITTSRTSMMLFISFLGKHTFLLPANFAVLGFYLFIRKNKRLSIRISALALTSLTIMFLLKFIFQRPRPEIPLLEKVSGFSFPSGHAFMSVTFYGLLIYIVWKEVRQSWLRISIIVLLAALIILIGISRIYLRVHYASDVIAGFAIGFGWLLLALLAIDKIEQKRFARQMLSDLPS